MALPLIAELASIVNPLEALTEVDDSTGSNVGSPFGPFEYRVFLSRQTSVQGRANNTKPSSKNF